MKPIGFEFKLNPDDIQHQQMLKTQFDIVVYMSIHTMNGAILASQFLKTKEETSDDLSFDSNNITYPSNIS